LKPNYTEFSYGFALTHELSNAMKPFPIAPHFPSLYEEGKPGDAGGADVALDLPGVPLFLQFKRSHQISTKRGIEWKAATAAGIQLPRPYLRFTLMTDTKSDQHDLLLSLDNTQNMVFYAAPRYHMRDNLNDAWRRQEVVEQTVFARPRDMGELDAGRHAVAFHRSWQTHAVLCSQAQQIPLVRPKELFEAARKRLSTASEPLETARDNLFEGLVQAYKGGNLNMFSRLEDEWERQQSLRQQTSPRQFQAALSEQGRQVLRRPNREKFERRLSRQIDAAWEARTDDPIKDTALEAQRLFGATMAIVQPIKP
jgi:hypothetical protein